jgi:UDP-N-acetylmuramoyl-L-alanyl-D-glutamate--2,6-diaminopimelate ligase
VRWDRLLPEACPEGVGGRTVTAVTADSRQVGPGTLFFALAGTQADGADYVADAARRGAVGVVADRAISVPAGLPLAVHSQARQLLGQVAARLQDHPGRDLRVVGITGTNGKTTVAWLVRALLAEDIAQAAVMGTLGWGGAGPLRHSDHTTPDAVSLQRRLADLRDSGMRGVAMEVSSHALDQERLAGTPMDGAVWTNLSPEHLDYHGDLAAYRAAKVRLFARPELGFAVLNADDPASEAAAAAVAPGVRVLRYGRSHGEVSAHALRMGADGIQLEAETPVGRVAVASQLVGEVNAANLLAAVAVGVALGLDAETIGRRLSRAGAVPGRMELLGATPAGARVWVDYAHTADALERALASVRRLVTGELWCVFGCGGERDTEKRPAMGGAADRRCDRVVLTNDNPRGEDPEAILAAVRAGMDRLEPEVIPDRGAAIRHALEAAGHGAGVIIAGKGHEREQVLAEGAWAFSDREVVQEWLRTAGQGVG